MAAMVECTCKNPRCKKRFMARVADRKRGWGRYHSKRCKAVHQQLKGGHWRSDGSAVARVVDADADPSWDAHKSV